MKWSVNGVRCMCVRCASDILTSSIYNSIKGKTVEHRWCIHSHTHTHTLVADRSRATDGDITVGV